MQYLGCSYANVVGIKRRIKHGHPSLAFLQSDSNKPGSYSVVEYGAGGGGMTDFKMDPSQYVGKALTQQLLESKFAPVPGSVNLYRFVQDYDDSMVPAIQAAELLVRLDNGVIAGVFEKYRLNFRIEELKKMPFRILGARISQPRYHYEKPNTILDLTNGLMTFSVSSGFYRYPSNERLTQDLA